MPTVSAMYKMHEKSHCHFKKILKGYTSHVLQPNDMGCSRDKHRTKY